MWKDLSDSAGSVIVLFARTCQKVRTLFSEFLRNRLDRLLTSHSSRVYVVHTTHKANADLLHTTVCSEAYNSLGHFARGGCDAKLVRILHIESILYENLAIGPLI